MFFIAGISISTFLIALLLFKKNKNKADWILTIWFLFISLHLLLYYFDISGITENHAFLAGIVLPFPLIHGPLLFLYASALTNRLLKIKILNLLHFLPFLLIHLYLINFYTLPGSKKIYILNHQGVGFESFVQINLILIITSGVGYIAATLLLIRKHQHSILEEFSDIEKINLKWLQYLTFGLGFIWLLVIAGTETQTFAGVVVYMIFIGFLGIKQTDIFAEVRSVEAQSFNLISGNVKQSVKDKTSKETVKYERSGLSDETKLKLKLKLNKLINQEKVCCEPNISLNKLASRLEVHPNYLSQYINEELGISFYDYINKYRIKEFKRIAAIPENQIYNVLSLAYECGFNSKSSFNRNFKKVTGETPSQFLESIKGR